MNKFKHTPGPWTASRKKPNSQKVHISGEGWGNFARVWAYTTDDGLDPYISSQEEAEANIRLICAAPELLEALQKFVDSCYTGCSKAELDVIRIEAEKVISKAIGTD